MSEQYSIYLQRRKLELVGILWLNNTRGHISSAFTADHNAALNILAAGRAVITDGSGELSLPREAGTTSAFRRGRTSRSRNFPPGRKASHAAHLHHR